MHCIQSDFFGNLKTLQHFVVYWVGSSLGALSSLSVWPHVEEAIAVKQA